MRRNSFWTPPRKAATGILGKGSVGTPGNEGARQAFTLHQVASDAVQVRFVESGRKITIPVGLIEADDIVAGLIRKLGKTVRYELDLRPQYRDGTL